MRATRSLLFPPFREAHNRILAKGFEHRETRLTLDRLEAHNHALVDQRPDDIDDALGKILEWVASGLQGLQCCSAHEDRHPAEHDLFIQVE